MTRTTAEYDCCTLTDKIQRFTDRKASGDAAGIVQPERIIYVYIYTRDCLLECFSYRSRITHSPAVSCRGYAIIGNIPEMGIRSDKTNLMKQSIFALASFFEERDSYRLWKSLPKRNDTHSVVDRSLLRREDQWKTRSRIDPTPNENLILHFLSVFH